MFRKTWVCLLVLVASHHCVAQDGMQFEEDEFLDLGGDFAPAEPEPVAAVPEPVAAEPEPVAAVPEPVAAVPEPVAAVPDPAAPESEIAREVVLDENEIQRKKKAEEEAKRKAPQKVKVGKNPERPNKIQYTFVTTDPDSGKAMIQVGFENPCGYAVGDVIFITGRSERRAGSQEAAEFLNRKQGHKVTLVKDNKDNVSIGGNGGYIWIEAMEGRSKNDFEGGNPNSHTADQARATRGRSEL